jgi:hypothetical protein
LIVATLLPQMSLIPTRAHTVAGVVLIVAGALLFAAACITNTPSPDRPRQNCLSYAVNFDTGEAWWISSDEKLDEWTRTFFKEDASDVSLAEFLGYDNSARHRHASVFSKAVLGLMKFLGYYDGGPRHRKAAAPMPPFGKTVLNVIEDRVEDGRRKIKLFVDSPRDAQEVTLRLESEVPVYRAKAFGLDVEGADKNWDLRLNTVPFEGGEIEIETDPDKPLRFNVRERSYVLPDIPGFQPRPPHMMTEPNRVLDRRDKIPSNHTYSICTYTF